MKKIMLLIPALLAVPVLFACPICKSPAGTAIRQQLSTADPVQATLGILLPFLSVLLLAFFIKKYETRNTG